MAIQFDPDNRRIVLDSATVTASQIWEAWSLWAASGENLKWLPALTQTGGDSLGSGISIPLYFFLENGWRVRPMESDHTLTITGNLFVREGGTPVVRTLGSFAVVANYTVPVQAQAVSTSGADPVTIAQAVRDALSIELARLDVAISTRHPINTLVDANVKYVNSVLVGGNGQPGTEWGPA